MTGPAAAAALTSRFLRSAETFPERPALEVGGETLKYTELRRRATAIASALVAAEEIDGAPLTAVFANRSAATFAGILGVLLRGHGYVPLSPRFPPLRNREILERSGCRVVVADAASAAAVRDVLTGLPEPVRLVIADHAEGGSETLTPMEAGPEDPAYLLFTSGSSGTPKGVLVTQANVGAFLDAIAARYDLDETDRLSQLFDLTFDLSVFDMFAAWTHGACLCCPDASQLLKPSDFIRDSALTVWFSVPSVALFLHRFGALKRGAFPTLRLSLFCGEALPADLARAWADSAPSSIIENLYGPTEATIACTAHRWDPAAAAGINGLVPIGRPLGATKVRVVDEALRDVPPGKVGELLLSGPQVVAGYWADEDATARAFVNVEGLGHAYRTGDRVVQRAGDAPLEYVGRRDSQIKILGHRVELEEVETVLREEAGTEAAVVGWPRTSSGAAGLVGFVANGALDPVDLRELLAARLPDYMVPREIRVVPKLPLNSNGKRDRGALTSLLEAE